MPPPFTDVELAPAPTVYSVLGEVSSPRISAAFHLGAGSAQIEVSTEPTEPLPPMAPGSIAAFFSPRLYPYLTRAMAEGRDFYYCDHAFYRRGKYYRIAKNARQVQISPQALEHAQPVRYRACRVEAFARWKVPSELGASIVVCPNSTTYMQYWGLDARQWTLDVVAALTQHTDRPIVIRWKAHATRRPMYLDLHDAWAVVVWNSACALDAILAGVPAFVLDETSTFARMGLSDLSLIESPTFPQPRDKFLWALAEQQWNLDEIAAGLPWRTVEHGYGSKQGLPVKGDHAPDPRAARTAFPSSSRRAPPSRVPRVLGR